MKYGIYLSGVGDFSDPILLADLAAEAELTGWDGVFIWDHIREPEASADPWVALAAIAMQTERIRLGPIVTPIARRRPWKLARETVTLDHLSKGRLVMGVGLGWSPAEFEAFGEEGNLKVRAGKLDEGLEILTGLWRGEKFSYQGEYFRVAETTFLPRPVQQPRIPVWVCGAWGKSKAPFRRAARWDGVVAIVGTGEDRGIRVDEVAAIREVIRQYRKVETPFDIVIICWSEGGLVQAEVQEVESFAREGLTWWLEDLSIERFRDLKDIQQRLHKGPPGRD